MKAPLQTLVCCGGFTFHHGFAPGLCRGSQPQTSSFALPFFKIVDRSLSTAAIFRTSWWANGSWNASLTERKQTSTLYRVISASRPDRRLRYQQFWWRNLLLRNTSRDSSSLLSAPRRSKLQPLPRRIEIDKLLFTASSRYIELDYPALRRN